MDQCFTSWVITSIPFAVSRNSAADPKDHNPSSQRDSKPPSSTSDSSYPFSELEFGDVLPNGIVPHDNLVWRIEGTPAATQQKNDVRTM